MSSNNHHRYEPKRERPRQERYLETPRPHYNRDRMDPRNFHSEPRRSFTRYDEWRNPVDYRDRYRDDRQTYRYQESPGYEYDPRRSEHRPSREPLPFDKNHGFHDRHENRNHAHPDRHESRNHGHSDRHYDGPNTSMPLTPTPYHSHDKSKFPPTIYHPNSPFAKIPATPTNVNIRVNDTPTNKDEKEIVRTIVRFNYKIKLI